MNTPLLIFVLVYCGMFFGGLPYVQLDRTGVAVLGAIVLVASEAISTADAERAVHLPTLLLLFSFMVVSAQLRLGGFYHWLTLRICDLDVRPFTLLGVLTAVTAVLSAVFSNDIVCLSVAPILIDVCCRRGWHPVPFLLALACAANIGSAATLIGNPQNMLIGGRLALTFADYLRQAIFPVSLSLLASWLIIGLRWRNNWELASCAEGFDATRIPGGKVQVWQAVKGLMVAAVLFVVFLSAIWPRDIAALGGAGILLMSRRLHSRQMLGLVDWQVLLLFIGLFIVNAAFQQTGWPMLAVRELAALGMDMHQAPVLFTASFMLSNLVSNVPAVMLLLPLVSADDGLLLALSSTFAGNLLIIGSVANLIVVKAAGDQGIRLDWREHATVGIPTTLFSLLIAAAFVLP